MDTSVSCNLTFTTSLERKHTVRIPNPSSALSGPIVDNVANRFIHANPFDDTVGELVALVKAERVVVNRIVLI